MTLFPASCPWLDPFYHQIIGSRSSCDVLLEGSASTQDIRHALAVLDDNLNATAARNMTLMNLAESLDAEISHAFPYLDRSHSTAQAASYSQR